MPPSPQNASPTPDEGSVGEWQRTRREALNQQQSPAQSLTEADYQPGQATTGGPTNLNVTRRQLSDTGVERLSNTRGLRDSAAMMRQVHQEQRADKQRLSTGNALRQARQISRTERDQKRGGKAGAGGTAIANAAAQTITAELLKQSWLNLISSFGLTLLYINFHFVARYFAGSQMFCRFGMEWFAVKKMAGASGAPPPQKPPAGKNGPAAPAGGGGKSAKEYALELASKPIELVEFIAIGLCDILVLIAFVLLAAMIFFIVGGWILVVGAVVSNAVGG